MVQLGERVDRTHHVVRGAGVEEPTLVLLAAYKRGAELLAYCQAALKDAEQQVLVLEKGVLKAFKPDGGADG